MLKKLLMVIAMSAVTATAFAVDAAQVEKSIELKDEGRPGIMKNSPKTAYSSELKSEF